MGRDIRRVPPSWEHPRRDCPHSPWNNGCQDAKKHGGKCYRPMHDEDFESHFTEWLTRLQEWPLGELQRIIAEYPAYGYSVDQPYTAFFEYYGGPGEPTEYRPKWTAEEATYYQLYETVSEGTPVSPAFATQEALAQYLAENGDYWYQNEPFSRNRPTLEQARSLVNAGWAMSAILIVGEDGSRKILDAYQQQDLKL